MLHTLSDPKIQKNKFQVNKKNNNKSACVERFELLECGIQRYIKAIHLQSIQNIYTHSIQLYLYGTKYNKVISGHFNRYKYSNQSEMEF